MAIVGYSPWADAANVGQGIGQALGTILFQLPRLKQEQRNEERRLQIQEQHYADLAENYKSNAEDRDLLRQQNKLLLDARVLKTNADAEAAPKIAESVVAKNKASAGLSDERAKYAGPLAQSAMGLNESRKAHLGVLDFFMPQNAETARLQANTGAAREGGAEAGLPLLSSIRQMPGSNQPMPTSDTQGRPMTPGSLFDASVGLRTNTPPSTVSDTHSVRIRNKKTGQTGKATPEAARSLGLEWEILN